MPREPGMKVEPFRSKGVLEGEGKGEGLIPAITCPEEVLPPEEQVAEKVSIVHWWWGEKGGGEMCKDESSHLNLEL